MQIRADLLAQEGAPVNLLFKHSGLIHEGTDPFTVPHTRDTRQREGELTPRHYLKMILMAVVGLKIIAFTGWIIYALYLSFTVPAIY